MKIPLCDKLTSDIEIREGEWIIQPKYDGLRCLFFFENGKFKKVLSRTGKPLFNIDYIGKEIEDIITYPKDFVLDGEILGEDWNETSSIVKSSKTIKFSENIAFHAFDLISLSDFNNNLSKETLFYRLKDLQSLKETKHFTIVKHRSIDSKQDAWNKAKDYLKCGYEGAVIKRLDSQYQFKRTKDWLKLKFTDTYDIRIVDVIEGTGKYINTLGAFTCIFKDHTVNVGTGFDDITRHKFWNIRKELIGKYIEVEAQEITKEGSLRFPVFLRLRDDKNEDK